MKLNVFDTITSDKDLADFVKSKLSPRELEVLVLLAVGGMAKQIAGTLNLSDRTVQHHRSRIKRTLGIRTAAEQIILGWRIRDHVDNSIATNRPTKSSVSVIDNVDNSLR